MSVGRGILNIFRHKSIDQSPAGKRTVLTLWIDSLTLYKCMTGFGDFFPGKIEKPMVIRSGYLYDLRIKSGQLLIWWDLEGVIDGSESL